jgi:hypothetical protein
MRACRSAGDGGQATMATIEHHPVDPYLGGDGATAGHAGVHAPLQTHPCVEACRACV